MGDVLSSTAFGAALALGFRHGFDWDHIAALTDLTGSQGSPRRSMRLATLYALGHAVMVVALGSLAILFAEQVPDPLDVAMERVVGATLVVLALWILWTAVTTKGAPPLRSRWMLVIDAVRSFVARRRG
jgi:high-affinity nickel-transport protein